MKLLSVIVTYYPDAAVLRRGINSFIDGVDKLLIWDNTPKKDFLNNNRLSYLISDKISLWGDGENRGIGYALNQAARYAAENGYDHLLTMDQDSYFEGNTFALLKQAASVANFHVAGIAPFVYIKNLTERPDSVSGKEKEKTFDVITSGTLYNTRLLEENGFFANDFFIDAIDTEYNLRAKQKGYHFIREPKSLLLHELGSIEMKSLDFRYVRCFNYSPMRCYYFARNHYLICRKYPSAKRWFAYWKSFFFRNFSVVLFESGKRKKVAAYFRGLRDGIRGKTGICNRYHA